MLREHPATPRWPGVAREVAATAAGGPHLENYVGAQDLLQQAGQFEAGNVKGTLVLESRRAAPNGDRSEGLVGGDARRVGSSACAAAAAERLPSHIPFCRECCFRCSWLPLLLLLLLCCRRCCLPW